MQYSIPGSGAFSATDSPGIASLFGCYFTSVFQPCLQPFVASPPKTTTILETIQLNEDDIMQAIKQLDPDKGPGADTIPSYFVKMTAPALTLPLLLIFNASLASGIFPFILKSTIIHPIHKSGSANEVSNYRPIAIHNTFAKLFERRVHQRVLAYAVRGHITTRISPSCSKDDQKPQPLLLIG